MNTVWHMVGSGRTDMAKRERSWFGVGDVGLLRKGGGACYIGLEVNRIYKNTRTKYSYQQVASFFWELISKELQD